MRVLITGGAGYIGAVLTERLIHAGFTVIVVDNFAHGVPSLAHLCCEPRLTIERGDCRDEGLMRPLIARTDVMIPLAAIVGAPACKDDMLGAYSINFQAVCAAAAAMSNDQIMLLPVTNSGYGVGGDGACDETSTLKPVSIYGQTKVNAEEYALRSGKAISFRLATVFGWSPRMRLDLLVNDFTLRAFRDRSITLFEAGFRRNYVHVRDVADLFVWAIDRFELRGQAFNFGLSDANLTKRELCEAIRLQVPDFAISEAPVGEDPDKRDYLVSNAKIEAAGFEARRSIHDGIAELLKGYRMLRGPMSNA